MMNPVCEKCPESHHCHGGENCKASYWQGCELQATIEKLYNEQFAANLEEPAPRPAIHKSAAVYIPSLSIVVNGHSMNLYGVEARFMGSHNDGYYLELIVYEGDKVRFATWIDPDWIDRIWVVEKRSYRSVWEREPKGEPAPRPDDAAHEDYARDVRKELEDYNDDPTPDENDLIDPTDEEDA
jgi:hypothetical protein